MSELIIRTEHTLNEDLANQVLTIYESSFPLSEQMKFSELVKSIIKGERFIWIAKKNGKVLGFAITKILSSVRVIFLEYFAVANDSRNRGIGTSLLQRMVSDLRTMKGADGIIFEVEPPTTDGDPTKAWAKRRINFYLRNGAVLLGVNSYQMPNLSSGGTLPMKLMWIPLNSLHTNISPQSIWGYIVAIYREVYKLSLDDPMLKLTHREMSHSNSK